ncbi:TPA: hypothetical protein ACIYQ4_004062 [Escherichia coli]|uniref:hypothetical protein n=1 Tax=Escherichia coli TaxID=562 RepID=UPI001072F928|nr:hypothetical protein [Escherichia coli]MCN3349564.1 hypothetical protein [Escherichia coli]MCN5431485.1 hypothetical protein [Escherichia coli]TFN63002.1 hypothetical protein ELX48_20235 [Escherichia coli]HDJ9923035.1 hypothetical protein [Escherichia coli]HDW9458432.1 hypothetical protein [Escherichia coli]
MTVKFFTAIELDNQLSMKMTLIKGHSMENSLVMVSPCHFTRTGLLNISEVCFSISLVNCFVGNDSDELENVLLLKRGFLIVDAHLPETELVKLACMLRIRRIQGGWRVAVIGISKIVTLLVKKNLLNVDLWLTAGINIFDIKCRLSEWFVSREQSKPLPESKKLTWLEFKLLRHIVSGIRLSEISRIEQCNAKTLHSRQSKALARLDLTSLHDFHMLCAGITVLNKTQMKMGAN